MRRTASRGLLLVVSLSVAAACSPPQAASDTVLVLTPERFPVVDRLEQRLAAGGQGHPPLPPLRVQWLSVQSPEEAGRAAAQVVASGTRLRAIYTPGHTFARGIQQSVPDVPIVFDGVDDPKKRCLIDSYGRPGRNATGHMHVIPTLDGKLVEALKDGFPALRRVVVLASALNVNEQTCDVHQVSFTPQSCRAVSRAAPAQVERHLPTAELLRVAGKLGLEMTFSLACTTEDVLAQVDRESATGRTGFLVPWHDLFSENVPALMQALAARGVPAIFADHRMTQQGGLMSLEPEFDTEPDRASLLILYDVLNGHDPAALPVLSPRRFTLVVNAAVAMRSGLQPSLTLIRRADVVLQAAGTQ